MVSAWNIGPENLLVPVVLAMKCRSLFLAWIKFTCTVCEFVHLTLQEYTALHKHICIPIIEVMNVLGGPM